MSKLQVFIFCDKYKNCGVIFFLLRETSKRVGFNVLNIILRELPLSNDNRVVNFYSLDLSNLCYYFFFHFSYDIDSCNCKKKNIELGWFTF